MSPMPAWLEQSLIRNGVMTENRATEKAKPRRCPRCGNYALIAIDAPVMAREVLLDAYPTTAAGELQALLDGRRTYSIQPDRKLVERESAEIRDWNADATGNVHAIHDCCLPRLPVHPDFIKPTRDDSVIPF